MLELLTWLQNFNWPIARDVLPFVLQYSNLIVEPVRAILKTDDVAWIHVFLVNVVRMLPFVERKKLKAELERIARESTGEEKKENRQ